MKKVLLINSNLEILPYPVAPLGVSLIAESLKDKYEVRIFDSAFNTTSNLVEFTKEYNPDYIGISIRNIDNVTMRKSKWYIDEISEKIIQPLRSNFEKPIIVGGSGFSIAPVQLYEYLDIDYGIYGEAEKSFKELLECLDNKVLDFNIKGIISKKISDISNYDEVASDLVIPWANIDNCINFEPYKIKGSYPIQTKRGCTHKCIYCSYPNIEGKKYRLRSVIDIVDEIEDVSKRLKDITFEFVDSTFNSPLDHAIDICKEILKRGLKIKLRTMGVNPGEVTEELIILMKKAGFSQIDCTPDSAASEMLKSYKKNFTKKKLIECADIIKKHNMPTMWFFMIGAPGETEATIKETFEFIDEHICSEDMVHITEGIRILPDTELYKIALKENVISQEQSVIESMYYVNPFLGRENLTEILEKEIACRDNVLNSINTAPSKELMQEAIKYRNKNNSDEPMFRTLLKVQKLIQTKKAV